MKNKRWAVLEKDAHLLYTWRSCDWDCQEPDNGMHWRRKMLFDGSNPSDIDDFLLYFEKVANIDSDEKAQARAFFRCLQREVFILTIQNSRFKVNWRRKQKQNTSWWDWHSAKDLRKKDTQEVIQKAVFLNIGKIEASFSFYWKRLTGLWKDWSQRRMKVCIFVEDRCTGGEC